MAVVDIGLSGVLRPRTPHPREKKDLTGLIPNHGGVGNATNGDRYLTLNGYYTRGEFQKLFLLVFNCLFLWIRVGNSPEMKYRGSRWIVWVFFLCVRVLYMGSSGNDAVTLGYSMYRKSGWQRKDSQASHGQLLGYLNVPD